ncbi:zinc finger protein 62 homolog [Oppia nitens]|uniref:zinc finger protein 62 homolog n=1 Tax=Oppia nitens TaxID=1686743 RepID=UPI0023DB0E8D|nr:zinc finger protein 62 homolog [Oppia nitens]
MKIHLNSRHSDVKTFICPINGCKKALKSKSSLETHLLIHKNIVLNCDFPDCKRNFRTHYKLKRHLAIHMNEPTLQCPVDGCDEKFFTDSEIFRHRVSVHNKQRVKYKSVKRKCDWPGCDYFGKALTEHKTVHTGVKKYVCLWPQCGKQFRTKYKLEQHMNIHKNNKPYACRWPGCDFRCAHQSNIRKHMKQMTSMVVTIDDILDQLMTENKRLLKELLFANKYSICITQETNDNGIKCSDEEYEKDTHVVKSESKCIDESDAKILNSSKFVETKTRNAKRLSNLRNKELMAKKCSPKGVDNYINKNDCHKSFKYLKPFTNHLKKAHEIASNDINLKTCRRNKQSMKNKKIYNKKEILKCRYDGCDKMYYAKSARRSHERLYHEFDTTNKLKCQYTDCKFECLHNYQLKLHMNRHSNVKPFICPISGCNKSLKLEKNLEQHLLIHTNTIIKCQFDGCRRQFRNDTQLSVHMAEHRSEPTLGCSVKGCLDKFFNEKERYRHRKLVHNYKRVIVYPMRRCVWPGCDYYGRSLTSHLQVHTGEKRYPCLWPQCGKRFRDKGRLKQHMNIHNNVKPYACRWPGCDYRCAHHSNVWIHMKQVHKQVL